MSEIYTISTIKHPYHNSQFVPITTDGPPSDQKMEEDNKDDCCIFCCQCFDSIMSICAWVYICNIITK